MKVSYGANYLMVSIIKKILNLAKYKKKKYIVHKCTMLVFYKMFSIANNNVH